MDTDIRELLLEDDVFDPFAEEGEGDAAGAFGAPGAAGVSGVPGVPGAPDDPDGSDGPDDMPLIGAPLEEREPVEDMRTPKEHIADLLESMPAQKRLLLRLIDFCRIERTGAEMDEKTCALKEYCYSVYSPVIFRELLEEAGAIRYLRPEGEGAGAGAGAPDAGAPDACAPDDAASAAKDACEPSLSRGASDADSSVVVESYVDDEGEVELEFLEIEEAQPGFWLATPEGLAAVDACNDNVATRELLGKEPQYLPIYQRILDYCSVLGGRSAKEVDKLVEGDPLLEEPRRFAGYFVGRLEKSGGLEWKNGWVTTEAGLSMLSREA